MLFQLKLVHSNNYNESNWLKFLTRFWLGICQIFGIVRLIYEIKISLKTFFRWSKSGFNNLSLKLSYSERCPNLHSLAVVGGTIKVHLQILQFWQEFYIYIIIHWVKIKGSREGIFSHFKPISIVDIVSLVRLFFQLCTTYC